MTELLGIGATLGTIMVDPGTAINLTKQLLSECDGDGDITLPKATLRIVFEYMIQSWSGQQEAIKSGYRKVV